MPPRTADKQLLLKKLSQKGPTRKTGKKRTKKAGEPHSITRLIGGPRVLDDSFVSQSDPRLMLSDHQGVSNQDNGALYPHTVYPFKFFVYFHERLLQMRASANAPGWQFNWFFDRLNHGLNHLGAYLGAFPV